MRRRRRGVRLAQELPGEQAQSDNLLRRGGRFFVGMRDKLFSRILIWMVYKFTRFNTLQKIIFFKLAYPGALAATDALGSSVTCWLARRAQYDMLYKLIEAGLISGEMLVAKDEAGHDVFFYLKKYMWEDEPFARYFMPIKEIRTQSLRPIDILNLIVRKRVISKGIVAIVGAPVW